MKIVPPYPPRWWHRYHIVFLDRYGWPVERIKGRPVTNMIRLLLWTRRMKRGWWTRNGIVAEGK
jgi:hypothetical protein